MPRTDYAPDPNRPAVAIHGLPNEVKINFRPRDYLGQPLTSGDHEFYGTLQLQELDGIYKGLCRLNAPTRRYPSYLEVRGTIILDEDKSYLKLTLDSDFEHNICAEVLKRDDDGHDSYETLLYNVPVTAKGNIAFINHASNGEYHYEGDLDVTDPKDPDRNAGTLRVIILATLLRSPHL